MFPLSASCFTPILVSFYLVLALSRCVLNLQIYNISVELLLFIYFLCNHLSNIPSFLGTLLYSCVNLLFPGPGNLIVKPPTLSLFPSQSIIFQCIHELREGENPCFLILAAYDMENDWFLTFLRRSDVGFWILAVSVSSKHMALESMRFALISLLSSCLVFGTCNMTQKASDYRKVMYKKN